MTVHNNALDTATVPIPLSAGGTNANLTASNGGVFYSTASAAAILAGTATADQVLLSGSSTTPSWSTATYPVTTTINRILFSSANNTISEITAANSAVLVSTSTGVPQMSGTMTNGQVIIGSTGATPTSSTITAGANISISNGAGTITIAATGAASFAWTEVSSTSQSMSSNNGYITNNVGLVTLTLPVTSAVGDELAIIGKGAGGWKIAQASGQQIHIGSSPSTLGATGSVGSANQFDSVYLVCTVANTTWTCLGGPQSSGLTIV